MPRARDEIDAVTGVGRLKENLWDVERTAEFLSVEPGTLYQWRSSGTGPRSYKAGGSVVYDPYDVRAYLLSRAREPAA